MKKLFLSLIVLLIGFTAYSQDIIVTNDGNKIEAKVTEVEVEVIKYKKFGDNDGPTYTMKKTEISTILYENGSVDVFKKEQQRPNNMYGDLNYGYNNGYDPYSIPGKGLRNTGIVFLCVGGAAVVGGIVVGLLDEPWAWFTLVPAGAGFLGAGAIFTAVGQSRMNRYKYYQHQNQVYSFYDIELNKDSKRPVKLGVGVNGVALKF